MHIRTTCSLRSSFLSFSLFLSYNSIPSLVTKSSHILRYVLLRKVSIACPTRTGSHWCVHPVRFHVLVARRIPEKKFFSFSCTFGIGPSGSSLSLFPSHRITSLQISCWMARLEWTTPHAQRIGSPVLQIDPGLIKGVSNPYLNCR